MTRKTGKGIIAGLIPVLLALGAAAARADTIYVSVSATKQGQFRGDIRGPKPPGQIIALKFQYEVGSPRDAATGQASGKRQHKPIVIAKEWGSSSPQFYQALVTNELLKEVKLDFVAVNANGEQALNHWVRLVNATVSNIAYSTDVVPGRPGVRHLEDITFTFQAIELHQADGNFMAADSWTPALR